MAKVMAVTPLNERTVLLLHIGGRLGIPRIASLFRRPIFRKPDAEVTARLRSASGAHLFDRDNGRAACRMGEPDVAELSLRMSTRSTARAARHRSMQCSRFEPHGQARRDHGAARLFGLRQDLDACA